MIGGHRVSPSSDWREDRKRPEGIGERAKGKDVILRAVPARCLFFCEAKDKAYEENQR